MLKQPKQHIEEIFNDRTQGKRNAVTLANALQKDIRTGFYGEHKFIFELLQNADDAVNAEQSENNILFYLHNDLLIVSHAGKHFTEEDVEKICDYAQQQYKDKSADENKIGYKGVGFKAVFSIADCAYILSAGYSFKFDRYDECWQEQFGDSPAPWPVTPIWCEQDKLPQPISNLISNLTHRVNFIFKLQNSAEVMQDLKFLSENPRVLLFLKHINSIKIIVSSQTTQLNKVIEDNGLVCLTQDKKAISRWHIRNVRIKIPEKTQSYLQSLDEYACPDRLKKAKFTSFTYAARVRNGQPIAIDDSLVYCYLPTQLSLGLPFLINGDFLLNPERTHLQYNDWNDFLLEQMGHFQIKWLSELAKNKGYQQHVLTLLSQGQFSYQQYQIKQAFNRGIQTGLANYPLVPSAANPEKLLLLASSYIDETGFYREFTDKAINDAIAKHDLKELDKLKLFGVNIIDFEGLLKRIQTYLQKWPELNLAIGIMQFLVKKYRLDNMGIFLHKYSLRNCCFILSDKGVAEKPSDLYFLPKKTPDLPIAIDVKFVHPTLLEKIPQLKAWLLDLGVTEPNYGEAIKQYVNQQLIKKGTLIKDDYEKLVNLLFMAYQRKYLLKHDISAFKQLKLTTKNNHLKPANQCFLSNEYRPTFKLEKYLPKLDVFSSTAYITDEDKTNLWHEFFKLLGVRSNLSVRYYDQSMEAQVAINLWGNSVQRYCDYLHVHDGVDRKNSPYRSTFKLYHFMAIDLLEYSHQPDISALLMLAVIEEFEQVRKYAAKASYNGIRSSLAYLQYYFQFEAKFLATTNEQLPASELLSPRFRESFGDCLPVANIEITLTQSQAAFFGFSDQLSLTQCMLAFDYLSKKPLPDLAAYSILIQSLLNLTSQDKNTIKQKNILLPTQNNTFAPASTLKFLCVDIDESSSSDEWLRKIPDCNKEQLQEAAALLGVKIVKTSKTQYQFTSPADDSSFQRKFITILPAIALIHGKRLAKDPSDVYQQLYQQFMVLKVYSVKQLELTTDAGEVIRSCHAGISDNMLLFKNRWNYLSTKHELFKTLCQHLQLSNDIAAIINDIISIELNTTEFNEWLASRGFDRSDFDRLKKIELTELDTVIKQDPTPVVTSTKKMLAKLKQTEGSLSDSDDNTDDTIEQVVDDEFADIIYSDETTIYSTPTKTSKRSASDSPFLRIQQFDEFDIKQFNKNTTPIKHSNLPEFVQYNPISIPGSGSSGKKTKSSAQSPSTTIDDELAPQIGAWGEQAVYYKLSAHYQSKYKNTTYKETNKGFILSNQNFNLTVIWHNKKGESFKSVDFEIHKQVKQTMTKRYVEVKSTRSNTPHKMIVSHNEWQLMKEKRDLYRFFRVYNAGDYTRSRIEKIKDPYGKLNNDQLNLTSLEIKL